MRKWSIILVVWGLGACDPVTHTLGVLPAASSNQRPSGGATAPTGGDLPGSGGLGATGGFPGGSPTGGGQAQSGGAGLPASGGSPFTGGELEDCGLVDAEPARAQMVVLMDTTFALPVDFLNPVAEGLGAFIRDPRSRGMDMGLYVLRQSCDPSAYSRPAVEVGRLPDQAQALVDGIPPAQINLTQPEDAVRAATARARVLNAESPDSVQAVAFITDGVNGGLCAPFTAQDLYSAVDDAQRTTPSIDTYIVPLTAPGVDASQWIPGATPTDLAVAGGTGGPYEAMLGTGGGGEALNEALQLVRAAMQPCKIRITRASLAEDLRVELAGLGVLTEVSNAAACENQHGYYFMNDADLTQGAILCPQSCHVVRTNGLQDLRVGSACP